MELSTEFAKDCRWESKEYGYRMPDELCQIVAFEDAKLGSWARKRHVAAPLSETSPPKITGREPFI